MGTRSLTRLRDGWIEAGGERKEGTGKWWSLCMHERALIVCVRSAVVCMYIFKKIISRFEMFVGVSGDRTSSFGHHKSILEA